MTAAKLIDSASKRHDTAAKAILSYCEQSGLSLRVEDEKIKVRGPTEIIAAWSPIIKRHRLEIMAELELTGATTDAHDLDARAICADYEELTACIVELCKLVGYSDDVQARMHAARRNLTPAQVPAEAAYFRMQLIRAQAGKYWNPSPNQPLYQERKKP
jgi:hypothetical protein